MKLTSKKLDSDSPPPVKRKDSFRRKVALRRGCRYEPIDDSHIPYIWAAYRRGVFAGQIQDGLDANEFTKTLYAITGSVLRAAGEVWVFRAQTKRGEIPVGVVFGNRGQGLEPHVFWFPEASARNRLECALKWLMDMKEKDALFIWVKEPDWKFFNHLGKYGVCRPVGKYRNFPGGGDAYLFQGVT